jgi:hypothetical protein
VHVAADRRLPGARVRDVAIRFVLAKPRVRLRGV